MRIICNALHKDHTAELFKNLKVLTVFEIYQYQLGIFMFKWNTSKLPAHLTNIFISVHDIHNYCTRNHSHLYHPHTTSTAASYTLRFQGPKFWNSLGQNLTNCSSSLSFKKRLKLYLLNKE